MAASDSNPDDLDDLDSGWEDEDDVDSGWDDAEAGAPATTGPPSRELSREEREARAARAATKKERLRVKAAEKAQRRKAKETAAAAKQKKSKPRAARAPRAKAPARDARRPVEERSPEVRPMPMTQATSPTPASRSSLRSPGTRLALFVVLLLVAIGAAALLLARR